jgi:hypothetical protein
MRQVVAEAPFTAPHDVHFQKPPAAGWDAGSSAPTVSSSEVAVSSEIAAPVSLGVSALSVAVVVSGAVHPAPGDDVSVPASEGSASTH